MDSALINFQVSQASHSLRTSRNPDFSNIKDIEQARKTAEDFEAMFLTQMVEEMFAGLDTENMFGGGHAEKMFRSMMAEEYGKTMAKNGGVGISDMVMSEILKLQEQAGQ